MRVSPPLLGKTLLRFMVAGAQALRDQDLDRLALHAGAAATEDALGGGVEQGDATVHVCADDGIRSQLENRVEQALRLPLQGVSVKDGAASASVFI